jgi:ketosteroid isomerase-like protein
MLKWLLVFATAASLNAADPKADVLAAMESWKQAMLTKDTAALDRLLHPDLTYSHSDGKTQTKADLLKSPGNNQSITFGETTVRVYGDTAILKGPIEFVSISGGGTPATAHLSVLQVWLNGPSGWQLVARQATKLNPLP